MKAFVLALATLMTAHAHAERVDVKLLGQQGGAVFFSVPKSHATNQQYIQTYAANFCSTREFCQAMFWETGGPTASKLPLTQKAMDAQLAQYTRNAKTGHTQMLWNCNRFPSEPKMACF